jgi:vacuolar-type H+-ATPase subunit H
MKAIKHLTAVIGLGLFVGTAAAQQQPPNITPTTPKDRVGRVLTPHPPKGNLDPISTATTRPQLQERNAVSQEVQDKINSFNTQRDAYVRQQEELRKQLIGAATDTERERIREQLRTVRERWLDIQRQVRENAKERATELMQQMPNRREMMREAAQEKASEVKSGVQQQIQDHKRRGGE